jgi:hypothetical protein
MVALLVGVSSGVWAAGETYKGHRVVTLMLGEKKVESDVPAIIFDDRTLLPVRALTEALGNDVKWDGETYTATVLRRPALDWAETAGKLRIHLKGIRQVTAEETGDDTLAGRLVAMVQIVNDGTGDQTVDLSSIRVAGAADSSPDKTPALVPHIMEVTGDKAPAPGTTTVTLARGERVTATLGYDLKMIDGIASRNMQLTLVNAAGGTETALRIKITITVDCSHRPCKWTITISF